MAGEPSESSWFAQLVALLTTYGEPVGNVLVYSSAYLAFIAMVYVAIVMVLLGLPPNLAPVVGGLVTFAIYANDRLIDVDADAASNPARTAFVRRHSGQLYALAAAAYGLAVTLSVVGGPITLTVTLMPGVFWVLYATDWIPDVWFHVRRLKEVIVVNSAVIAFAWSASAILLPIGYTDAPLTAATGFVFAYFFLRSFANSEVPNVRDVAADRATGVSTLPVAFGVGWTRRILYGVDLLTASIVGYAGLAGFLPALPTVALLVGIGYSLGVTALLGRVENEGLLAIAAECEYVIVGLALVPVVYGA